LAEVPPDKMNGKHTNVGIEIANAYQIQE